VPEPLPAQDQPVPSQDPQSEQQPAAPDPQAGETTARPAETQPLIKRPLPPKAQLDRAAVDQFFQTMTNRETGLLSHSAFLFFLVGEYTRHRKAHQPFSLIRCEMCMRVSGPETVIQPLPSRAVREVAKRIFTVVRPLDWVGHYENTEYAFLLPHTDRKEALELAEGMIKAIYASPLTDEVSSDNLGIFMGVASVPDDCNHPGILLACADEARKYARQTGKHAIAFGDLPP